LGAARRWSVIGREMERAGYKSRPSARIPSDLVSSTVGNLGRRWESYRKDAFFVGK